MKKHLHYLQYVLKHKWHVLRAAISLGIVWRGLLHDLSKFRPDEWRPYSEWFFGQAPQSDLSRGLPSQDVTLRYQLATARHFHRNDHHFQHWLLFTFEGLKAIPIPVPVMKEMLADWYAFARDRNAVDGWKTALEFWTVHQEDILMHPTSRKWLDANLKHLAGISGAGKEGQIGIPDVDHPGETGRRLARHRRHFRRSR